VDNQLPAALARWLTARGFDALHALDVGLALENDRAIWDYCQSEPRIVISKDEDFFSLATRPGEEGRLIWVRIGNCRKIELLESFASVWPAVKSALDSGERIVEIR
jgi:predicted nuclease of predicted toxin-antitoxin system